MENIKKWIYKNAGLTPERIREAARGAHIPPVIATLLLNRGIEDGGDMRVFLTKSMQGIENPLNMTDMEKAADRIIKAIEGQEEIVVYGDYDVDGITSTSLLYSFLKEHGAKAEYYIPDRYSEGYGVNIKAVNRFVMRGVKLMITVDCGITAIGETEFARLQGMDVIITDHHTCKEKLPNASAVVNPKRPDGGGCYTELAGVGVAFKLALALAIKLGIPSRECFDKYAPLAAIGTVADVVPLLGENRIIVDRGLKLLDANAGPGVDALLSVSGGGRSKLSSSVVAFTIAPRLNAAGRMLNASKAVELLMSQDPGTAYKTAEELENANRQRQSIEQDIFDEAVYMAESDKSFEKDRVLVLAGEGWHQGVIGIVASRIMERYYKPCILISCENEKGKGSGRSVPGFNLFEALSACEDELTGFGGHAAAAGLNINKADIAVFRRKINEYAMENMNPESNTPSIAIDCRLRLSDVTVDNAKILDRLEPYGMGNERPVFAAERLRVTGINKMGADDRHLKMKVTDGAAYINVVAFRMGYLYDEIKPGDFVDIAFQMDINNYMNTEQVQMLAKDIKLSGV